MAKQANKHSTKTGSANVGFESELWRAADALRSNMDAAEYKHVVLGLLFLKYISDAFEELHAKLEADKASGADPEDADEYRAVNIFWVPKEARWSKLKAEAKQPTIGKTVDDAMLAIERDNPSLKGVLPKEYSRPGLDKQRLGQLIDMVGNIGLGDKANRSKDMLGRVYEYFLSQFASAEGKKGGQFYTPRSVVQLLVEMLAPYKGRVYDPACGSGGMFVQSEKFVEAHGGKIGDISIYGQESNHTTWRLAKMNLAIRGIDSNLGKEHADSFHRDMHPDLKADFVIANPPFNDSDWRGELLKDDKRWQYGIPPASNANFAWVQHFIYHLAPNGHAGFVLANSSMSSNQSGEGDIRKAIIEADLVDCMVALPGHLFYSMFSQVCLWFLSRDKRSRGYRDRRGQTLFIDARNLGKLVTRTHRELQEDEVHNIAATYNAWARGCADKKYEDVPGFCRVVSTDEIRLKRYNLAPSRYVAAEGETEIEIPAAEAVQRAVHRAQPIADHAVDKIRDLVLGWEALGLISARRSEVSGTGTTFPAKQRSLSVGDLMNELQSSLSQVAVALYRAWFVEFEPVLAKAEGRATGLPPELDASFPSELEDSSIGEIPLGWRIATHAEFLKPVNERIGSEPAPEYSATVRGLELRELRFNKVLARAQAKNKKIRCDDLVFGLSRRTINFGLMTSPLGSVSPVYEVFAVDGSKYVPALLELHIRHNIQLYMDILKPGAREGQPIDRDFLLAKEVLIPDIRVQLAFWSIVNGGYIENAERIGGRAL